ncbi:hypothetical protein [Rhizobacter fulvus]
MPSEKQLDQAFDAELRDNSAFLAWLTNRLAHGQTYSRWHWSRANYAWGKVKLLLPNHVTGALESVWREGETDVLVVLEGAEGGRLGVHIENKRATGSFTPFQPDVCAARAEAWVGNPKYESYHQWETVLLAPRAFYKRNELEARKFTTFVPHEEVAPWVPLFG